MSVFHWPGFRLEFDPESGAAITYYPDGTRSGCAVVPDDHFHAGLLGITPEEHRLQHELAHHLVGDLFGGDHIRGCPIIWRDAHGIEQPQPESNILEWRYTALQYHSLGRRYDEGRIGALIDIEKAGADPYRLGALLRVLMDAARLGVPSVEVEASARRTLEAA